MCVCVWPPDGCCYWGAAGSQLQMKDKTQDDDNDDDVWLFLGGIHFGPGCALEARLILFDKLRGAGLSYTIADWLVCEPPPPELSSTVTIRSKFKMNKNQNVPGKICQEIHQACSCSPED